MVGNNYPEIQHIVKNISDFGQYPVEVMPFISHLFVISGQNDAEKIEFLKFPCSPAISVDSRCESLPAQNEPRRSKSMAITKTSLINSVCNNSNVPKQESTSAVESLLEIIKQTLASGEDILISGFGKFCLKDKRQRRGRNPQTGDVMMMDARRIVIFKCSNLMRDKINGKG